MLTAIVQARMSSQRLPGKIFKDLSGKPLISHVLDRLSTSKLLEQIVLATTDNVEDDVLAEWAKENGHLVYRGDENNVLKRFYDAAKMYKASRIVRITADDPFKDIALLDQMIEKFERENLDFITNNNPPSFPEGLDVEILRFKLLEEAHFKAKTDFEKEHVTQYVYKNLKQLKWENFASNEDRSFMRWTIDTEDDYSFAQAVYSALYKPGRVFSKEDIFDLLSKNKSLCLMNNHVKRSHMYGDEANGKN